MVAFCALNLVVLTLNMDFNIYIPLDQSVMAKKDNIGEENYGLKCHFGISNQQGGNRRLPFAYTERVFEKLEENNISPKQGIFFDGQIYDAYEFVCGLIKSAKTRIILIDNYVDETVLTMLDKREKGTSATIYTQKLSPQLKLDIANHNAQYPAIEVKEFTRSHDRFLILDNQVYLIGASLKDLGKKWFALS